MAGVVTGGWAVRTEGSSEEDVARVREFALPPGDDFTLAFKDRFWTVSDTAGNKLKIDFADRDYRRPMPKGRKELLVRALGGAAGDAVLDLTAGMGIDSIFLARAGYNVTAVERHPVLAFLLQEALKQASDLPPVRFLASDARAMLETQPHWELVYFDPMYPSKKKSALPKQEMVLFRKLVGDDIDAADLATYARRRTRRLVVKRPLKAPPLIPNPHPVFEGTTVRYDVYLGPA